MNNIAENARRYAHLHCHTHYSLLDGASRIPELVKHVKSLGMNSCAITDHGNLYGAIEFYSECRKGGVNPIVGYEAYVAPTKRSEKIAKGRGEAGFHLTLLAQNNVGFRNLIKMATAASLEGYYYVPRIDKELLESHKEGIICLSGCASSEFSDFILKDKMAEARALAEWFHKLFGKNFYVEIQNNEIDIQRICREGAIDIANRLGLPLVATSDAHYLNKGDAKAHDVLLCINTGAKYTAAKRMRYGNDNGVRVDQFYVCSPDEMYSRFPGMSDAVQRSQEIADGCDLQLDFKKRHFPVFLPPTGETPEAFLRSLCLQGMRDRYGDSPQPEVIARLEHELDIVCRMGFAGYFLIVWDFVRFGREQGIPSGARGSAVGAVISYVLYLSHVCPVKYGLLFERFLDPNRAEAPDIDIDLCQERREEVIAYVRRTYGEESVAQIATFGTLGAKQAIRDVARVMDLPLFDADRLAKTIPEKVGTTIDSALAQVEEFAAEYNTKPAVRDVIDVARGLEGTNRQAGVHAAGVVISDGPLVNHVPLHRATRKGDDTGGRSGEAVIATQWVMGDIEKVGLLKMDFLGLRTLTLLDNAVRTIRRTRGEVVDIYNLPEGDKETYALLQRGDTQGVFQLESPGIRELLKRMKPDRLGDLIAVVALYRPGPLDGGMVDDYVNRKHGVDVIPKVHPELDSTLEDTYGVLCIAKGTRVAMADGRELPIENVKRLDRLHSVNLATRRVEGKECHGCAPTRFGDGLEIALDSGHRITVTADHPVLTWDGMKEAGRLSKDDDLVAIAFNTPVEKPSSPFMTNSAEWLGNDVDVAYLLGILIGNGALSGRGTRLATGTKRSHDILAAWIGEHFPNLRRNEKFAIRCWYIDLSSEELLNDRSKAGNRKTMFRSWIEGLGLAVKSPKKFVPEYIFSSSEEVRSAFLSGLIDSDGHWQGSDGSRACFYTSASERLLDGVVRLCQIAGVLTTRRPLRVHLHGQTRLREYLGKNLLLRIPNGTLTSGRKLGWVPRCVIKEIIAGYPSKRAFCQATGVDLQTRPTNSKFVCSKTAMRVGIELGDLRYQKIVSITPVKDVQFYGISVEDHHNLLGNGIVIKNCYQESAMQILNRVGGIELTKAYACIKAISKKKQEDIDSYRDKFITGATERGLLESGAEVVFDLLSKMGGYAFNKSHATAYANVSYQTAYLKANYPAEFMAALLSSDTTDREKLVSHIEDARRIGVEVVPPDVQVSEIGFTVDDQGRVVFGLKAIKGVGEAARELVVARDSGGAFTDIFQLCSRVSPSLCGKSAIEKLIKAGALDSLLTAGQHRAQLVAALPGAVSTSKEEAKDRGKGQLGLFDAAPLEEVTLPDAEPWTETERLRYEKESLDMYLSSHPLAQHEQQVLQFATHTCLQAGRPEAKGQTVVVGGVITGVRVMNLSKPPRNGGSSRYVRFKLEDLEGMIECVMWPDVFAVKESLIQEDAVVYVSAGVEDNNREQPGLIATSVTPLADGPRTLARGLAIRLFLAHQSPGVVDRLSLLLTRYRTGNNSAARKVPVYLVIQDDAGRKVEIKTGSEWIVDPTCVDIAELEELIGSGNARFMGVRRALTPARN